MRPPLGDKYDPARAQRMRELRAQRSRPGSRFTQKMAAQAVGVTERAYQEWEKGGPIDGPNLIALARVLRTTPDFILDGEEGRPVDDTGRRLDRLEAEALSHARSNGVDRPTALRAHDKRVQDDLEEIKDRVSALAEQLGQLAEALPDLTSEMRELRQAVDALPQRESAGSRSEAGS
jgi:DNA-binding XRE family transcriptional regulator